jgi:hypothetical protein
MADGGYVLVELVERNLNYLNRYAPTFPAPVREMDLSAATEMVTEQRSFTGVSGAPEGYVKLSGDLTGLTVDDTSPVFVLCGNTVYEATPAPNGFSLCLEGTAPETMTVFFYQNGNLVAVNAVYEA